MCVCVYVCVCVLFFMDCITFFCIYEYMESEPLRAVVLTRCRDSCNQQFIERECVQLLTCDGT